MSTNGIKANNVAIPLEKQLSEILQQLGKGQQIQTAPKRKQVIHEILSDLKNSFLKCTVLPYGLDELGISSDSSALYLSVDTFGKVDVEGKSLQGCINLNTAAYSAIAQQIFKILTTSSSAYQYVSMKPLTVYANTAFGNLMPTPLPEVSFVHNKTSASCKIRLENYFSVQRTRLFNFYCRLDIRFWPVLMLVRHWGTRLKIFTSADSLDFQNYTICLLLVHYLVSKKIIPSLNELQGLRDSGVDKPFIVNNFDISFCSNVATVKPAGCANPALQDVELRTLSIVSILKGFFSFCATFDFRRNVICPFLGESLEREVFYPKTDWKSLPESISVPYLNGSDGKIRPEKLYLVGPICVQDIFELTTNVTRTVSEDEAARFTKQAYETAKILENVLNQSDGTVLSDAFIGTGETVK